MNLPGNRKIIYVYEKAGGDDSAFTQPDRLSQVQYKEGTVVQDQVTYQYADSNNPYSVTSILDKNGVLRWSVTYNAATGHALTSSGPGGAFASTVSYQAIGANFSRTVTNALGKNAVYNYSRDATTGYINLTSIVGQASAHCPRSTSSLTYDSNGFVASSIDEEGRETRFTRNGRGLPTDITEAYGTSITRHTTIQWGTQNNIPTQVAMPGLTKDYTYTSGNLTTLTLTDTTTFTPYSIRSRPNVDLRLGYVGPTTERQWSAFGCGR